ncbi:DUF4376 domain-containing protein [Helicobacter acinonychis]|uniref:DUF4376 domain-containing protein n=2 Tax=Helicobacter acinonychis TaxID=212 RepID=UPI00349FCC54
MSSMVLENISQYEEYIPLVFEALKLNGGFQVLEDGKMFLTVYEDLEGNKNTPTKEQFLKKIKEVTLEKKKQELKEQIDELCKEKMAQGFFSSVLGEMHAYGLSLEDQMDLQGLVLLGSSALIACAKAKEGGVFEKKQKKTHTKEQIETLLQELLKHKHALIAFYEAQKERLDFIAQLEEVEAFEIKEYLI